MPWKVTSPVEQRAQLIRAYETGRFTVTELAKHFGVSRKTVYETVRRGLYDLEDHSHAAHSHPNATPEAVVAAVIREKRAHPTWGPLKLLPGPTDPSEVVAAWPAPSTRGAILAREGLTRRHKPRRHVPASCQPFGPCDRPNAVWGIDFKGWFRTKDGQRCDPLTITDAYSRMLLCCQAVDRPDYDHVQPVVERVFREYGLPDAIRSDNGPPFASIAVGGLSPLAVWWVKLGIGLERIEAGHPEQNGRHERMHRTLKLECCRHPAATVEAQQHCFEAFRHMFNHKRPHQALGLKPPATFYAHSPRTYPSHLEDPIYPEGTFVRRVRSNGQIKWKGNLIFVSQALTGEAVGISEGPIGMDVYFGPITLGTLDAREERMKR